MTDQVEMPPWLFEAVILHFQEKGIISIERYADQYLHDIICRAVKENYRILQTGDLRGFAVARAITPANERCPIASLLTETEYPIPILLSAYADPGGQTPVFPNPNCPNFHRDGGGWCRCTWATIKKTPSHNVDPDFAAWLDKELSKA